MPTEPLSVSRFVVNEERCVGCGKCAADCPNRVIRMEGGLPRVSPENDANCILCQHCLAVCPVAAASVGGLDPDRSERVRRADPAALESLLRSRRSVRRFSPEPVDDAVIRALLDAASYASTGKNSRRRRFAVVRSAEAMAELRRKTVDLLLEKGAPALPAHLQWLVAAAGKFAGKNIDVIFRDAPHLLVVSTSRETDTPREDGIIAVSWFELCAHAHGLGTLWCGMVNHVLHYLPESRKWLGIPANHVVGYSMLFGKPGVEYARAPQYRAENVDMIDEIAD